MPHQNKRETPGSKCSEKTNAPLETFRISNNVTVTAFEITCCVVVYYVAIFLHIDCMD